MKALLFVNLQSTFYFTPAKYVNVFKIFSQVLKIAKSGFLVSVSLTVGMEELDSRRADIHEI